MKKKIYLLITLVISLFMFTEDVEAAKELTCVYDIGSGFNATYYKMIVQDSNGNLELYFWGDHSEEIKSINDPFWIKHSEYFDSEITFKYNDKEGILNLTECPKYSSKYHPTNNTEIELYYEKKWNKPDYVLLDEFSCNCVPDLDKHDDWLAKCSYGDEENGYTDLYFSETKYKIETNRHGLTGASGAFDVSDVIDMYGVGKWCPSVLWEYYYKPSNSKQSGLLQYYLVKPSWTPEYSCDGNGCTTLTKLLYEDGNSDYYEEIDKDDSGEGNVKLDSCEDLLGPELLNWINNLMNYVKIIVPILLIGFGIFDFTGAIFAGSEDDMKKSQSKFFKRIIAALLIFISPIIINLFLTLANEVWSFINPNTCIK